MSSSVLRLGPDDAPAFRAIRLEALERHPEAFQSTFADESAQPVEVFADRLRRGAVFGATVGDAISGMAGFYVHAGEKVRHKGVLWGMYVRKSARGKGIAAALVESVVVHAREHVEILSLSVITTNPTAIRLYERMGFVAYGTERHALKLGEAYFDEILMAKPLA